MPRPDTSTPVEATVNILRAAAPWCLTHKGALLEAAEPAHLDGFDALADALEAAASAFNTEQRDAVSLTPRRDALLTLVRQLLTSTVATVRLHHKGTDHALRATARRFVERAPSDTRSLNAAQRALIRLTAALTAEPKATGHTTPKLQASAADLAAQVKAMQADYAREGQEYSQAASRFESLRAEAVKRVALLQLAAEAISFDALQPLTDLHAIFDTHNPAPIQRSTADDLLKADSDLHDLDGTDDDPDSPADDPAKP